MRSLDAVRLIPPDLLRIDNRLECMMCTLPKRQHLTVSTLNCHNYPAQYAIGEHESMLTEKEVSRLSHLTSRIHRESGPPRAPCITTHLPRPCQIRTLKEASAAPDTNTRMHPPRFVRRSGRDGIPGGWCIRPPERISTAPSLHNWMAKWPWWQPPLVLSSYSSGLPLPSNPLFRV